MDFKNVTCVLATCVAILLMMLGPAQANPCVSKRWFGCKTSPPTVAIPTRSSKQSK